jgi:hypothetical protein
MSSVKCKPRLRFVSEYPVEKRKEILETLVFVEKFKTRRRRRTIRSDADLKWLIASFMKQNVSVDGAAHDMLL